MFHATRAPFGSIEDVRPGPRLDRSRGKRRFSTICFAVVALSATACSGGAASAADSMRLSATSAPSAASMPHPVATGEGARGRPSRQAREREVPRFGSEDTGSREVIAAIRAAGESTGLDPAFLMAVAWKESRLDPDARNPHTSADGLLQFTAASWMSAVRDFGGRHGIRQDGRSRSAVLELRRDPRLSATLAAEMIRHEGEQLSIGIGRPANRTDLYLTHRLGTNGAARFLRALQRTPNARAADVIPTAARHAPGEFGGRSRHLTVAQVYAGYGARLESQMHRFADVAQGRLEVADAR